MDADAKSKTLPIAPHATTLDFYRQCLAEHAGQAHATPWVGTGTSERAVGWTKGKQHTRYSRLMASYVGHTDKVLDYGCGLGHFGSWLRAIMSWQCAYTGVDVLPEYIEACKTNPAYHDAKLTNFYTIETPADVRGQFDHIFLCGVFNFNAGWGLQAQINHIVATLQVLATKLTPKGMIHVDFLAGPADVDFQALNRHYQSPRRMMQEVQRHLTPRYVIDRSYLPYEWCMHLWRPGEIDKEKAVYKP